MKRKHKKTSNFVQQVNIMNNFLIKQAKIVNEGKTFTGDVWIKDQRIQKIATQIDNVFQAEEINGEGKFLLPGVIDDQVHFREPGLTHKAEIYTEAKAAVAGGTTSFMEMPNTKPSSTTQQRLEDKYHVASQTSLANYSFFMGASNDNLEEVLRLSKDLKVKKTILTNLHSDLDYNNLLKFLPKNVIPAFDGMNFKI